MENEAVIINKYDIIEKCLGRIDEEYDNNSQNLEDYRKMDCIVLNLQRACEATIDIAMYIVSTRKLGIPQSKKEAFQILENDSIITKEMSKNMKNMAGFRNIAIHDYKNIDEEVIKDVVENHLYELIEFAKTILQYINR
jgi:uncharacterized protein YutE (UPF0331/DUF86 family)